MKQAGTFSMCRNYIVAGKCFYHTDGKAYIVRTFERFGIEEITECHALAFTNGKIKIDVVRKNDECEMHPSDRRGYTGCDLDAEIDL